MDQSKYLPLYLKHRPQTLGDLVGQKSVVKTLTNAIENNRIAHAYLFTGPRGCGKTSSARILAKSINCQSGPTVTPCLQCASCVSIKESSCPSVFEIDAASNNSVDDARMLIERAPLVAQGGRNKLYIVDECHMLTKEAFNALLKTIEEPPPNVIFILATTEEHKVPPTILSRCQRLMFRLANHDELAEHLASVAAKEKIEIQKDALELITRKSGGGLRDALGLLDQASLLARPGEPVTQKDLLVLLGALDEDVLLTLSKGILERNGKDVLDGISGLVMQGREPALIAQELAKHFLNLAKASYVTAKEGNADEARRFVLGSKEYIEGLVSQASQFERVELTQMVEHLDNLEQALKRSTQPSMTLEIALLSLCHRHDITSIRELEQKIAKLQEAISSGEMPRPAARPPGGPGAAAGTPARPPYGGQSAAPAAQSYTSGRAETPPRSEPAPRQDAPVSATPGAKAPPERVEPAASAPAAGGFALIQGDDDDEDEATAPVIVSSVQTMDQAPAAPANGVMYDRSYEEEEEEGEGFATPPVKPSATVPPPAQRQAPPPQPQRQAPPPASEYVEGDGQGELSQSGLDEMWGELLEAIHKRSIPAFSLVSTHAFPIRFESKTLTIGVPKEFFQKSIENKTNKIMEAYRDVWNDEVRIIVKVIAEGAAASGGGSHSQSARGGDSPMQAAPRNDVALRVSQEPATARLAQDQNNAYNRTPSNTATAARPEPGSGRSEQRDLDEEADRGGSQSASSVVSQSKADTSAALDALGDGLDSGKIKEAYRIFEGPGSRLIS